MKQFTLRPHIGIGPIKLGAPRSSIRTAMAEFGCPVDSETPTMDYFHESSIQVEYEGDGTASFIGVSSHPETQLFFDCSDLFDLDAETVFTLLANSDQSGDHSFNEYEYVFPAQIITLWEVDRQYDYRQGEARGVWGQIGCGDERYLDAITQINNGVLNTQRK